MSLPPSKRRRVNRNNVLFKPFKSPMRFPSPGSTPGTNLGTTVRTQDKIQPTTETRERENPNTRIAPKWNLSRSHRFPKLNDTETTELSSLRREESRLLAQLSKVKLEVDEIKQARGIEKSDRDIELLRLVTLWKSASQQAAEEVYATIRDKVHAQGGMRRWREMERERKENVYSNWQTEEDAAKNEDDDEEDDEREDGKEMNDGDEESQEVQIEESESFSMDVLLRHLNIELDVIGYDAQEQRWIT